MDSPTHTAMKLAATPSKLSGQEVTSVDTETSSAGAATPNLGAADAVDISSPSPASLSFARQKRHPPALSVKPRSSRKVATLFSGGGHLGGEVTDSGSSSSKKGFLDSSQNEIAARAAAGAGGSRSKWDGDEFGLRPRSRGEDGAQTWESGRGKGTTGDNPSVVAEFSSPVRKSRPSAASNRFTPQRNLVGLFGSPQPLRVPTRPHNLHSNDEGDGDGVAANSSEEAPVSTTLMGAAPLLHLWSKREEKAAGSDESPSRSEVKRVATAAAEAEAAAAAVGATTEALGRSETTGEDLSAPSHVGAAVSPAPEAAASSKIPYVAEKPSPACRCGCSSSPSTSSSSSSSLRARNTSSGVVCCVSNKAFENGEAMRTLEVLVKRERIGVSALASWRVAELKRRLVHMKLFPTAEAITLVPTFPLGGAVLEDDVMLDTLDADVTYKARQIAVAVAT